MSLQNVREGEILKANAKTQFWFMLSVTLTALPFLFFIK